MRQPVQWDPTDPLWLPPKPRRSRSLLIAGSLLAVALVAGVVFSLFAAGQYFVRGRVALKEGRLKRQLAAADGEATGEVR